MRQNCQGIALCYYYPQTNIEIGTPLISLANWVRELDFASHQRISLNLAYQLQSDAQPQHAGFVGVKRSNGKNKKVLFILKHCYHSSLITLDPGVNPAHHADCLIIGHPEVVIGPLDC